MPTLPNAKTTLSDLSAPRRFFVLAIAAFLLFWIVAFFVAPVALALHYLGGVAPLDAYAASAFLMGAFGHKAKVEDEEFWPSYLTAIAHRAIILLAVLS